MREMKDSGVEWIGEIPKDWVVIPHKQIMHKVKEICEHYNGEDIISLSMNGVRVRDLDAGGKMPTTFDGYQYVEPDNMRLCLFDIDVTPRCVGVVKNFGLTSPAYSRFVVHKGYLNRYYDYLLRFIDDVKVFVHLAKNLRSTLTETEFGVIKTIVPSFVEQHEIADYLDAKCAQIDRAIARQQEVIEKLKEYKLSVITEAVTKGLNPDVPMKDSGIEWIGEIPEHWVIRKIRWDFSVDLGKMLDAKQVSGQHLGDYLRNTDVQWNSINFENLPQMDFQEAESERYQIKEGDLLVCEGGEIGRCAIVPDDFPTPIFYQKALHRVRSRRVGNGNVGFLAYVMFCMSKNQYFFDSPEKATIAHLPAESLNGLRIPSPRREEQIDIVQFLNYECGKIDEVTKKKLQLIDKLTEYKKSLIYEVVTGKREV